LLHRGLSSPFFLALPLAFLLCGLLFYPGPAGAVSLQYEPISDRPAVVDIRNAGDGSGRLYLVEQAGRIWVIENGEELDAPFLDLRDRVATGGERGLLSLAFPPDYRHTGAFYTWYTNLDGDTVLSRFRRSTDPDQALASSEEIILTVAQPRSNHNGGQIQFGTDGYLYLGIGDGGGAGDPDGLAQNPTSLLGKLIRIDVDPAHGTYAVPPDNPFIGEPLRDEIWALGLRNPWRMAFDPLLGDLYIADVGQNRFEEINVQGALDGGGQNYGWNRMEGEECFQSGCDTRDLVLPVGGYDHGQGCSVTGGVVYRGSAYPDLHGRYLFGDYCTGTIWGLRREADDWRQDVLDNSGFSILTFGAGEDGSVYLSAAGRGVFRLSDGEPVSEPPFSVNAGLNDAWFDPDTAGQGFFINVFPDRELLFLSWFTYDTERPADAVAVLGEPGHRWFTAIGPVDATGASLEVSVTEGGRFDATSPEPESRPAGTLRVDFTGCNQGMVTFRLDGLAAPGQIPIERVVPDNIALCEALGSPAAQTR
jgi:glucose/arabinose dehydrogenase